MKNLKKLTILILLSAILINNIAFVFADSEIQYIDSVESFMKIKDNPYGEYTLTSDLDFDNVEYTPFAFYGTLNGEGHCIKNVTVNESSDIKTVIDANRKEYEAVVAGLFSFIENATLNELNVYNIDIDVETSESLFLGTIAGYACDSIISGCNIEGKVYATTSGHCFGTGGVIGFSDNSHVLYCDIDVTLICVDTDIEYKDEQFMGGVYSIGCGDMINNTIHVYGYDSDHGYVHNGGMVGCFMYIDTADTGSTSILNNSVTGRIKFFEDNKDRRAYCKAYRGETMSWDFAWDGNTSNFYAEEIYDYSEILLPEYEFDNQLVGETDILLISTHADDEQLFFAGLLPYYTQVRNLAVQVLYAVDHTESTGRNQEREAGLYEVGVKAKLDTLGLPDQYSENLSDALKAIEGSGYSEEEIILMLRNKILKYRPKVIVTHDINGEYSHGQHILINSCLRKCLELYSDEFDFLEKVYFHLYDENQIELSVIDEVFDELGGKTPFQITQEKGFSQHVSQHWTWFYGWIYGKNGNNITKASEIKTYSPLKYGLYYGNSSLDKNKNDVFEGLKSYAQEEAERIAYIEEQKRLEEERIEKERQERIEEEAKQAKIAEIKKICIISGLIIIFAVIALICCKTILKSRKKH